MTRHTAENLARIMADQGLSIQQVSQQCGVDRRTVQAILHGHQRAHARTLHRLAQGLGVSIDELFLDPARLVYRRFDRQTNPVVQELIESHPEQFLEWSEGDFAELASRVGTGGALTPEGALAAAQHINQKRELLNRFCLVLETDQRELLGSIVNLIYERVIVRGAAAGE
jgi:transcriptional regulator with XRE-family HTH domain